MPTEPDENGEFFDDLDGDPAPAEFDPRSVPVRWSWLSRFSLSAAHARHAANRGNDDAGSLTMRLGTGVHAVTFGQPFAVYTETKTRRGKVWDEFQHEHVRRLGPHAPILNEREYAHAKAMADALRADPIAAPILFGEGVEHEKLIEWERDGRRCRSRLDAVLPGCWIADLKTCRTAQPARFVRAATWAGYPGQLCFYDEADAYHTGRLGPDGRVEHEIPLYIVAIESTPPYVVVTYQLDEFAIELGRRTVGAHWSELRVAESSGYWGGYVSTVATFTADDPDETMGLAVPRERPSKDAA